MLLAAASRRVWAVSGRQRRHHKVRRQSAVRINELACRFRLLPGSLNTIARNGKRLLMASRSRALFDAVHQSNFSLGAWLVDMPRLSFDRFI